MESPGLGSSSSWTFGPKVGLEEGGLGQNPSNIPASLLALYHLRSRSREYKAANRQAAYQKLSLAFLLRKDCTKAVKILWYFGFGMTPKALGNVLRAVT